MKFAHMADCHIGAWTDPKMRELSHRAFLCAVDICMRERVGFVLVCGDLFNTALPTIESLKVAVDGLKTLADGGIPVYAVPGSHDFSPSGKTILDVLERAGLLVIVASHKGGGLFVLDKKSGAKIYGMLGLRGGLERGQYGLLDSQALEREGGFKIFMLHSAVSELRLSGMDEQHSVPLSMLPKGFDYYAAGHVHVVLAHELAGHGTIAYPGPLFPNNFAELEQLGRGGLYIVDAAPTLKLKHIPIEVCRVRALSIDCNGKNPEEIGQCIVHMLGDAGLDNTVVTFRLFGELKSGKPSDINYGELARMLYVRGAYFVMKNTAKLTSKEFEAVEVAEASVDEIENALVDEASAQQMVEGWDAARQKSMTQALMQLLDREPNEGERAADFEKRLKDDAARLWE